MPVHVEPIATDLSASRWSRGVASKALIARFNMALLVTAVVVSPVSIVTSILVEMSPVSAFFLANVWHERCSVLGLGVEFVCPRVHGRTIDKASDSKVISGVLNAFGRESIYFVFADPAFFYSAV